MAADLLSVSTALIAAAAMLILAVMLVLLRFSSGANRAFALFLVLQAAVLVASSRFRQSAEPAMQDAWFDVQAYFLLAIPAAVVYFFIAYTGRPQRKRRGWGWGLAIATLGLCLLYLQDHCLTICHTSGAVETWTYTAGPLYVLQYGFPLAIGMVALALVLRTKTMPPSPARSCASLIGVTLALGPLIDVVLQGYALFEPGLRASTRSVYSETFWFDIASWTRLAAGLPILLALVIWARNHKSERAAQGVLFVAAAIAVAAAVSIGGFYAAEQHDPTGWSPSAGTMLIGAWRIVTPAIVAYGLLRHRLFELDPVLKRTIGPTAIASIFLAVFFSVSKIIENIMGDTYGAIGGGVAAGLLLFALSPLERLGSRIAGTIVPRGKVVPSMEPEELRQLYRDQAALVWSDGVMRPGERVLLDNLRSRFGISPESAAALEREALAVVPAPLPPAPRTARRAARRPRL